ncbi:MAG TPA: helix-turn-helix transcriptional regulator [Ktedonobacteraceae bacterium]|nr:helix-turn-helix transcriptional regulator [Ktedonobacteraceae bacterium]
MHLLIQARLRQGWVQADLAEKIGVATKTVARWGNWHNDSQPGLHAQLGALLHPLVGDKQ